MNKKILALVLAFVLVFSTVTVAFAEEIISVDVKALAAIGMLKGDGNGVTADYVKSTPTRLQAAILLLRLKGLEEEAKINNGTDNFKDVLNYEWAEGKNIMSYLKAHPELGWIGNEVGNFMPGDKINEQSYYKVLLEALGYKQNTGTVVGDFEYAEVFEFAKSIGLAPENLESFTIDNLSSATVDALKNKMKDGKLLVEVLIENGKINKQIAIDNGLYEEATTDANIKAAKAIGNSKVEVTFDKAVTKAFAEKAANYKINVKGTTTALEVKAAVLEGEKVVVLETAAQTAGTAYALTVKEVTLNFAGIKADTVAPQVTKVGCIDTNTVKVTFDKVLDKASAENAANYTLNNGASVKSVVLDSSRKFVTLTTEGISANKVYTLKLENVKSIDLVAIKTVSKSFVGKTDIKAPLISKIVVVNNERVKVYFADDHGLNKASAENAANYEIKSATETLEIVSLKAIDEDEDANGYLEVVEITTATQKAGTKYTLTINNLVDGSVSANAIAKALTKTFIGRSADTSAPVVSSVTAKSNTKIQIQFSDANRIDVASAIDVNNYVFDKEIVVEKAELLDADALDDVSGKTVVLTVSGMEKGKAYKLTISNVADEFGNVMKTLSRSVLGVAEDTLAPYVKSVKWVSLTTVKVEFDGDMDAKTANDPTNYVIDGNLGAALKAKLEADNVTVTLTTPTQAANKTYKITINNLLDANGNELSNVKAYFTSSVDGVDNEAPEIVAIDTMFNNEIRVTFSEKVNVSAAEIDLDGTDNKLVAVGKLLNDGTTVVFKASAWAMEDLEYKIAAITGIKDLHNNTFVVDTENMPAFYGIALENDQPEVSSIEQIDVKTIRVIFTEPVAKTNATISSTGTVAAFTIVEDPDALKNEEGYATVDLLAGSNLKLDATYKFNFTSEFKDYCGTPARDENDTDEVSTNSTEFTAYYEDKDAPIMENVEAINEKTLKVTYNENIALPGSYRLADSNGVSAGGTMSYSIDENELTISLSTAIKGDEVYTLKPITGAKDIAGNTASVKDVEFTFLGSSVKVADYIRGIQVIDGRTIKVLSTKTITVGDTIKVEKLDADGNVIAGSEIYKDKAIDGTSVIIDLKAAILADASYKVTVGAMSYEFSGVVEDGDLAVEEGIITFTGWNTDDYVVNVVYSGDNAITAAGDPAQFNAATLLETMAEGDKYIVEVYKKANGVKDTVLYAKEFTK